MNPKTMNNTLKLEMISKYPLKKLHSTPLLFIHGTLHTASCWDVHFLDYFAQYSYTLVGEAFFNDLPDEQLLEYWKQMQDDSFMAFLDMVALDLPKPEKVKTPLLVLGAARDNMIGSSEIEATARAYNTQAVIIPDVAHNSMLERNWQAVAERILAWLNKRSVANASVQVAELADVTRKS